MGIDFQFIAYRGAALSEAALAQAIQTHVREVRHYRHARSPLPEAPDLHGVALYEAEGGGQTVLEVRVPTLPDSASLTERVQAAWKAMRQSIHELPPPPPREETAETEPTTLSRVAILARELSRGVGKVFWFSRGDHACVGGYASFEHGKLVDPAAEADVYVDGEGYLDVPSAGWRAASGIALDPSDVFFAAFPDDTGETLRGVADPEQTLPFDPMTYEVSLA